jgi:hypothetical protein
MDSVAAAAGRRRLWIKRDAVLANWRDGERRGSTPTHRFASTLSSRSTLRPGPSAIGVVVHIRIAVCAICPPCAEWRAAKRRARVRRRIWQALRPRHAAIGTVGVVRIAVRVGRRGVRGHLAGARHARESQQVQVRRRERRMTVTA